MHSSIIKHIGKIEKIEASIVTVKIVQHSACSSCQAKSICSSSEQKEKYIEIDNGNYSESFVPGESVYVVGTVKMAFQAILFAFVLPLLLLFGVLITTSLLNFNEGVSALFAMVGLFFYYVVLYFFRNIFKQKLKFTLTKI